MGIRAANVAAIMANFGVGQNFNTSIDVFGANVVFQ